MTEVSSKYLFKDGDLHVTRKQDVEPYLDFNKEMSGEAKKFAPTFRQIASIPNVVLEKWINDEGAPVLSMGKEEFSKFVRRKLEDPDWKYLKTTSGRV